MSEDKNNRNRTLVGILLRTIELNQLQKEIDQLKETMLLITSIIENGIGTDTNIKSIQKLAKSALNGVFK
jgi:phosphoribosylformimino-5-aminoimidazole carboxamide ribonucleotide (ProFAR) isomerase